MKNKTPFETFNQSIENKPQLKLTEVKSYQVMWNDLEKYIKKVTGKEYCFF